MRILDPINNRWKYLGLIMIHNNNIQSYQYFLSKLATLLIEHIENEIPINCNKQSDHLAVRILEIIISQIIPKNIIA